jgi:nitrite reductase (NADH) small subunit
MSHAAATVRFTTVCELSELPIGLGRAFQVGDEAVAVFRTRGGKVFAVANKCPHKGGPLADGMLVGDQVVCPLHSFRFDSAGGECDQPGVCAVGTYPVEVIDGFVRIGVPGI